MSDDDKFFERLRIDARPLRHRPDEASLARIRASIHARLTKPTVADVLAAWFRPLAATAAAIALAAAIGIAALSSEEPSLDTAIEIQIAGDTYRVGE